MPLIKGGQLVADPWVLVGDEDDLPPGRPVIVSLARWAQEREHLLSRGTPLGVRLASHQAAADIAKDVAHLALVALEFPTFRDGRPYSNARLLRERYWFSGELRAVGNVLRDQLLFMNRCGFDAFEIASTDAAEAWQAAIAEISVFYQRTGDGRTPAPVLRQQRAGR